jgi:hypothetical protein
LSKVGRGASGELVGNSHSTCGPVSSVEHASPEHEHTVDGSSATEFGEGAHRTIVLLCEGVLDGRDEETGTGGDHAGLDSGAQGILGAVGLLLLLSHIGVDRVRRWRED